MAYARAKNDFTCKCFQNTTGYLSRKETDKLLKDSDYSFSHTGQNVKRSFSTSKRWQFGIKLAQAKLQCINSFSTQNFIMQMALTKIKAAQTFLTIHIQTAYLESQEQFNLFLRDLDQPQKLHFQLMHNICYRNPESYSEYKKIQQAPNFPHKQKRAKREDA